MLVEVTLVIVCTSWLYLKVSALSKHFDILEKGGLEGTVFPSKTETHPVCVVHEGLQSVFMYILAHFILTIVLWERNHFVLIVE